MAKLTLSVEKTVVSRARRYAKQRGVSVSSMVETYLDAVAHPSPTSTKNTPILQSLRGTLKKADIEDHRRHLSSKYK